MTIFYRKNFCEKCLAEKYKHKLYNVCYDPTRNRTHEYLSRNLIDNSFEFNWKKNNGMILQFVLIYQ